MCDVKSMDCMYNCCIHCGDKKVELNVANKTDIINRAKKNMWKKLLEVKEKKYVFKKYLNRRKEGSVGFIIEKFEAELKSMSLILISNS